MDPLTGLTAFAKLLSVLKVAYETGNLWKSAKSKRFSAAIDAVMNAVTETRAYLPRYTADKRNLQKEVDIVHLWTRASRAVREFDKGLAVDLLFKANYWAIQTGQK